MGTEMNRGSDPLNGNPNTWAMILHLSMLLGLAAPVVGFVAPIVIWQVKKNSMPEIDAHGCAAANWMISVLIYAAICFVLSFVLIGIPMAIVLGILAIVFPIIAGVKASDGIVWNYPLSFRIF